MKKETHHQNAKAVVGFLIVAIGAVLLYKLYSNEQYFGDDPAALQNYILLSFVGMGFLVGLFYLVSKPAHVHKSVAKSMPAKTVKKTTKKKKK